MKHLVTIVLTIVICSSSGCERQNESTKAPLPKYRGQVKLLLFLVADAMPQDYLVRFRPFFSGGLAYLLSRGAQFVEAHHGHARTVTCAGHASLITGSHPRRSGIISNGWYDLKSGREVYCVKGEKFSLSPKNLLTTGLGDWMRNNNPRSKVYSISGKNTAAIIMGGQRPNGAFWYSQKTGDMITGPYYYRAEPQWLRVFNDKKLATRHFGKLWKPIPVDPELARTADIVQLNDGVFVDRFPHAIGSPTIVTTRSFFANLYETPFLDRLLVDFALELIDIESLGKDQDLDLLAISFSALDSVGHRYGPNSYEVLDTAIRLDRELDRLFRKIDSRIGLQHVAIAFSSDHGIQPLPEFLKLRGVDARRETAADVTCIQSVSTQMQEKYGSRALLIGQNHLNHQKIHALGHTSQEVMSDIEKWIQNCPMIEKVWTRAQLEQATEETSDRDLLMHWRNYHPERSGDFQVQLKEHKLYSPVRETDHGTPYRYDTHVPMIFILPDVTPAQITERVLTVDLAPTIARQMGIPIPESVDGRDLSPLLKTGE